MRNNINNDYLTYTTYKRYVDLKKLNFIIESIEKFSKRKQSNLQCLDVGCGEGAVAVPLASLAFEVVGLDLSVRNLKRAREKAVAGGFNISFVVGDAETPMFLEKSFDVVICSEVLEHLCVPKKTLNEVYKLLRRNGLLIVTFPNGYGPYSLIYDHFRNKIMSKLFRVKPSEHKQIFTFSRIIHMIRDSGFQILKVAHSDFLSFLPLISKFKRICYYDCKLADKLPHAMVSGWYIVAQKAN